MGKSRHREAQIIAALKQVEAPGVRADVDCSEQLSVPVESIGRDAARAAAETGQRETTLWLSSAAGLTGARGRTSQPQACLYASRCRNNKKMENSGAVCASGPRAPG